MNDADIERLMAEAAKSGRVAKVRDDASNQWVELMNGRRFRCDMAQPGGEIVGEALRWDQMDPTEMVEIAPAPVQEPTAPPIPSRALRFSR